MKRRYVAQIVLVGLLAVVLLVPACARDAANDSVPVAQISAPIGAEHPVQVGAPAAAVQPSLQQYRSRIAALRRQIPALIKSAEAAADACVTRPTAHFNLPHAEQRGFAEEFIRRAGGLGRFESGNKYPAVAGDVVLMSVRSWPKDGPVILRRLEQLRADGCTTILFASEAGRPKEAVFDYFVDNSAASGDAAHGSTNALANVTLGWMWCCEYASAMTRRGKAPGILLSIGVRGGRAHDQPFFDSREGTLRIDDCATPIAAGELAELYVKRVEQLLSDLESPRIQQQIGDAAAIVANRIKSGGKVGLSGVGHLILYEVLEDDFKTPWKGFTSAWHPATDFKTKMAPGDLLVWIGYMGMRTAGGDFGQYISEAGLDLIKCVAPRPTSRAAANPAEATPDKTLALIDQCWVMPDAEVPIPWFPDRMAPVSGINAGLIARMLDDEVARRLGL